MKMLISALGDSQLYAHRKAHESDAHCAVGFEDDQLVVSFHVSQDGDVVLVDGGRNHTHYYRLGVIVQHPSGPAFHWHPSAIDADTGLSIPPPTSPVGDHDHNVTPLYLAYDARDTDDTDPFGGKDERPDPTP